MARRSNPKRSAAAQKTLSSEGVGEIGAGRPKYQEVYEALHQKISSGQYGPGARLPTEDELIAQFGVSRTTIIRALRDLQTQGLLRRRRGSGSYVQEAAKGTQPQIGLIWPGVEPGSIFIGVQQALAREANALGWSLRTCDMTLPYGLAGDIAQVVQRLMEKPLQGLFFLPDAVGGASAQINRKVIELSHQIPMVLIDRDVVAFPDRSGFDLVSCDNQRGGFLLGRHLTDVGSKRILFVSTQAEFPTTQARLIGCQMAVAKVPGALFRAAAGDLQTPAFLLRQIHDFKPDAVVCDNDHNAAMVLRYALQAGIVVPRQLKITGFDDTPTASLLPIALTTIRQPVEAIASRAIRLMRDRLERPTMPACHVQIDCELVIRETSQ